MHGERPGQLFDRHRREGDGGQVDVFVDLPK